MWHVWGKRNGYRSVVDTPEGERPKEYLGVGERVILKPILKKKKLNWKAWTGLIWLR
jgi:hypothetical protein